MGQYNNCSFTLMANSFNPPGYSPNGQIALLTQPCNCSSVSFLQELYLVFRLELSITISKWDWCLYSSLLRSWSWKSLTFPGSFIQLVLIVQSLKGGG
jgi:hypothetical protein